VVDVAAAAHPGADWLGLMIVDGGVTQELGEHAAETSWWLLARPVVGGVARIGARLLLLFRLLRERWGKIGLGAFGFACCSLTRSRPRCAAFAVRREPSR
jgi:hypothetical protein